MKLRELCQTVAVVLLATAVRASEASVRVNFFNHVDGNTLEFKCKKYFGLVRSREG